MTDQKPIIAGQKRARTACDGRAHDTRSVILMHAQSTSVVYFVQQGIDGPIKIGKAASLRRRLLWLQCGNPERLYLRATIPGGFAEERALHEAFAAGHIRGEWFRADTPELQEFIDLANEPPIPDDDDACERCGIREIAPGRRKYCEQCA